MLFKRGVYDASVRTTKEDLYIPVLTLLAQAEKAGAGPLTTYQLRSLLRQQIQFSTEDVARTPGDTLPRVERALQNLVSHNDLRREGWVRSERPRIMAQRVTHRLTLRGRAVLADHFLEAMVPPTDKETLAPTPGERRVSEADLGILALHAIAHLNKVTHAPVGTTQLQEALRKMMPVTEGDLTPTGHTSETPFARAVRNLVSHDTLKRRGWVRKKDDGFVVTLKGKAALLTEYLECLPSPSFTVIPAIPPVPTRRRALAA